MLLVRVARRAARRAGARSIRASVANPNVESRRLRLLPVDEAADAARLLHLPRAAAERPSRDATRRPCWPPPIRASARPSATTSGLDDVPREAARSEEHDLDRPGAPPWRSAARSGRRIRSKRRTCLPSGPTARFLRVQRRRRRPACACALPPTPGSAVVASASFDDRAGPPVQQSSAAVHRVRLWNGRSGFIASAFVRSPVDYRAIFQKAGGQWRLRAFVAGDDTLAGD